MQILFAAPFILAAGIVFTVLSLIPRARRWAIPIPCGILGSGALACLAIFVGIVVIQFIESPTPTRYPLLAFYWATAISGLAGGVAVGAAARWVAAILPAVLLRLAVFLRGMVRLFRSDGRTADLCQRALLRTDRAIFDHGDRSGASVEFDGCVVHCAKVGVVSPSQVAAAIRSAVPFSRPQGGDRLNK
jgi:hypothetical protein